MDFNFGLLILHDSTEQTFALLVVWTGRYACRTFEISIYLFHQLFYAVSFDEIFFCVVDVLLCNIVIIVLVVNYSEFLHHWRVRVIDLIASPTGIHIYRLLAFALSLFLEKQFTVKLLDDDVCLLVFDCWVHEELEEISLDLCRRRLFFRTNRWKLSHLK